MRRPHTLPSARRRACRCLVILPATCLRTLPRSPLRAAPAGWRCAVGAAAAATSQESAGTRMATFAGSPAIALTRTHSTPAAGQPGEELWHPVCLHDGLRALARSSDGPGSHAASILGGAPSVSSDSVTVCHANTRSSWSWGMGLGAWGPAHRALAARTQVCHVEAGG